MVSLGVKNRTNIEGHTSCNNKNKEKYHFSQNKISVNVQKAEMYFLLTTAGDIGWGVGKFSYKNNKEIICSRIWERVR